MSVKIGMIVFISMGVISCDKKEQEPSFAEVEENTIIKSYVLSPQTKSTIGEDLSVSWEAEDKLFYYSYVEERESAPGTYGSNKENLLVGQNGPSATVDFTLRQNPEFLAVLMPGKDGRTANAVQDYNLQQFGYSGINPDQDGSFAFANIAVAYTDDPLNTNSLEFKNITAILKFTVSSEQNVTKVTMKTNNAVSGEEINGRINVDFTADAPSASYRLYYPSKSGKQYQSVIESETAMDGTYYFAVMPTTLTQGFTLVFNDGKDVSVDACKYTTCKYSVGTTSEVVFRAGNIKNVGNALANATGRTTSFTISAIAADNNWDATTQTQYSDFTVDNTIRVSATGNNGYLTGGTEWRCYGARSNGQFTVSCVDSNRKIKSIKFTYNYSNSGVVKCGDTPISSKTVYEPSESSNSLTFTVGASDSSQSAPQVRITGMVIETK